MAMEESDVQIRYKILQTVYRNASQRNSDTYRFVPEILGSTYSEMNYHLRCMKSRGLLLYSPRMLMRHYSVTLLTPGKEIVESFESAFFSEDPERDKKMKEALAPLK